MYDLVSATSVSVIAGCLCIDPTLEEEACEDGRVVVALMPKRTEITHIVLHGTWDAALAAEAVDLCVDGCTTLDEVMRHTIREEMQQEDATALASAAASAAVVEAAAAALLS
eukprot:TRINITY_DN1074_c0_g1_i1.p2 TRINITY_DN1074_c0_g1~~TRINITY_DN1074_c0_g1_i1.p2  ORF type:complete len:126 (+),score=52.50 TRINITY_DN1074_c0_g1_i1:43-378(+)